MAITKRSLNRKNQKNKAQDDNKKLKQALQSLNNKANPTFSINKLDENTEGKTLLELIGVFETGLTEEQLSAFIENKKFTIIELKDITEPGLYECPVYYPFVDLKVILSILVEKDKTKIFIIGNEDNKLLLVNTFYNFYNIMEMVQITAYHIGRVIHNYFDNMFKTDTENQLLLNNSVLNVQE